MAQPNGHEISNILEIEKIPAILTLGQDARDWILRLLSLEQRQMVDALDRAGHYAEWLGKLSLNQELFQLFQGYNEAQQNGVIPFLMPENDGATVGLSYKGSLEGISETVEADIHAVDHENKRAIFWVYSSDLEKMDKYRHPTSEDLNSRIAFIADFTQPTQEILVHIAAPGTLDVSDLSQTLVPELVARRSQETPG